MRLTRVAPVGLLTLFATGALAQNFTEWSSAVLLGPQAPVGTVPAPINTPAFEA